MSKEAKIKAKVCEILAEQFDVDPDSINPTDRFVEDLGADSLDIVELIMWLEDEYGLDITDDETEQLQTVQSVIDYIVESI